MSEHRVVHVTLRRLALPVVLAAMGCIMQVVDVRYDRPGDGGSTCLPGERRDPSSGACLTCTTMPPPPGDCLCGWEYREADFPFCDAAEAFYACLPCSATMLACNDFIPTVALGQLGLTRDCARIAKCCQELASDVQAPVECCACGSSLECQPDPSDPEHALYILSCDPEPDCHGIACPIGDECDESWQTCTEGECTPACQEDVTSCNYSTCRCEPLAP